MSAPGGSYKWLVGFTCLLGIFMEVLDTSVANVALSNIQGSFAAGTDEVTWVITSYLVANAIILPITGWLGNFFGRKRLYLTCLGIFTLASLGSGAAQSLSFLIFMRVVQGLAGGAMVPLSQAITFEAFPSEEQGYAAAIYGIGAICGPILGPLLGGWITDNWSWPWIFYINIPVGLVAFVAAMAFVKDPSYLEKPKGRVDYWSLLFIAVGLGCLELFLNRGERYDWFASTIVQVFLGLAVLGIALFIWRSLTAENPLVDLRIFRLPEFSGGMALIFVAGMGMYGTFICVPIFVQTFLHFTPTWAGIVLAPAGACSMLAMALAGFLVGKVHVRILVGAGFVSMSAGVWLLTRISLSTDVAFLALAMCMFGFGMGLVLVPIGSESIRRIPPQLVGTATGMFNLMRNEGGSVGIALCTTVLAQRAQFHHARLAEHVTMFNPGLQQRGVALVRGFFPKAGLDPASMPGLAAGLVGAEVNRQSYLLSFIDIFAFLAASLAVALPLVLLMRHFRSDGKHRPMVH
ncbi:DHA2 family efflux MFS transporter permease subunit [Geothrix sp. 21YS21S-2]|uniref:DHA2 family efflux MFS transporter permease subunit n=1 Tax=Geothrix sp. 21YS21S-2 TaxID=3068893 RepID=UPI0027B956B4|nr:DHA2 family efflux MFS transporter permease subunit [Geothrix sp. 21YS21S-2]